MEGLIERINKADKEKLNIYTYSFGSKINNAFNNLGFEEKIDLLFDFVQAYNNNELGDLGPVKNRFENSGPICMSTVTTTNQCRLWMEKDLPVSYCSHHVDSCGRPYIGIEADVPTIDRINDKLSSIIWHEKKNWLPNGVMVYTNLDLDFERGSDGYIGRLALKDGE